MSSSNMLLRQVDGSQQAIQKAASSMMKQYDHSSHVAVTEWRNALQSARVDQILPLLYVCNEVLQNSKRNRGNKFLEAYSPVLNQSMQHMARVLNNGEITEKIRRVIKIWGDRQVYSIRFINELLTGLEPYRTGRLQQQQQQQQQVVPQPPPTPQQSTAIHENKDSLITDHTSKTIKKEDSDTKDDANANDDDEDDIMDVLSGKSKKKPTTTDDDDSSSGEDEEDGNGHRKGNNDNDYEDDDDDDDVFGDNSHRPVQLNVEINVDDATEAAMAAATNQQKRRRGSLESGTSQTSGTATTTTNGGGGLLKKKKKSKVPLKKSMSHFVDIWNRIHQLQQTFDIVQVTIQRITNKCMEQEDSTLENLVGDELLAAKKQNDNDMKLIVDQQRILHQIATEQYQLEQQIKNQYVPWFEMSLKQDQSDLDFCIALEGTIRSFQPIHYQLVLAYEVLKMEWNETNRMKMEQEQYQREQEEIESFRIAALAKETEAKPGMVWNPSTREYQSLNTDESWRD